MATAAALRQQLADLRGPGVPPRPLDARALAALAANPGCRRRALLDGAGVDKAALAEALGSPSSFGQSQFAFARGNSFEARVKADGGAELLRLYCTRLGNGAEPPAANEVRTPDLTAPGPEGRAERTRQALTAAADGGWTLLDHPLLRLEVAGSPVFLEPDAIVVPPDGAWTVVEIKSFPILDGAADASKVGAAARQSAVYVLALESLPDATVRSDVLLVCPKDFSNLPAAEAMDVRPQLAVTRRQLARLTHLEAIAAALPENVNFDLSRPAAELLESVAAVDAAYAPECLSSCELAFHCRSRARQAGEVVALGRSVRGELGSLRTVDQVLAAARGSGDGGDTSAATQGPDGGDHAPAATQGPDSTDQAPAATQGPEGAEGAGRGPGAPAAGQSSGSDAPDRQAPGRQAPGRQALGAVPP
ncbi:hypothetical protein, partial [Streptomyces coryli]|uniref:hypothetical protein n=1 Tax=Streptomyces coryli TaxID=1128680 RepID=UPI001F0EF88D